MLTVTAAKMPGSPACAMKAQRPVRRAAVKPIVRTVVGTLIGLGTAILALEPVVGPVVPRLLLPALGV